MKIYKRSSGEHRESGVAIVRYPDGKEITLPGHIAKRMVENHPEQYCITQRRPSKRPWRHR